MGLIVAGMCVQDMHLSMPAMVTATVTRARPQFLSEWNGRSPPAPRADRRSDHEGAVDTTGYGRMNGSRQGQRWGCGGFAMCPDYWKPQTKGAPGKFTDTQPRRHDFLGVSAATAQTSTTCRPKDSPAPTMRCSTWTAAFVLVSGVA